METSCNYELNMGWIEFGEKEIIFSSKKLFGERNKFYITDYYNIKLIDFEKGSGMGSGYLRFTTSSLIIETKDKKFKFKNIANSKIDKIREIIDKRKGNPDYSSEQKIKGIDSSDFETLKEHNIKSNKKISSLLWGISITITVLCIFWWLFGSCGIRL